MMNDLSFHDECYSRREIEKVIDIYYVEDDENIAQAVKEYREQRECKVTILMTVADAGRH